MSIFQKFTPEWALRLGLGTMFLYSGYDMFSHPGAWTWAIPDWFKALYRVALADGEYLKIQGTGEIVLGLLFLAWFLRPMIVKYLALLATIHIGAILVLGKTGIDAITFRDLGVLGAALGLFLLLRECEQGGTAKTTVIS